MKVRHAIITSLAAVTPTGAIFFLTIPVAANAGKASASQSLENKGELVL